jgi:hypothetical protein
MPLRPSLRRARALAPALLAVLLLTGCAQVRDTVEVTTALDAAGVRNAEISTDAVGTATRVTVAYPSDEVGPVGVGAETRRVQAIVWRTLPVRIDQLVLDVSAPQAPTAVRQVQADRATLEHELGPRPAALDRAPGRGRLPLLVLAGAAVLVLVLALLTGMRAVARRDRRRQLLVSVRSTPSHRALYGTRPYVPPGGMRTGSAWVTGPRDGR